MQGVNIVSGTENYINFEITVNNNDE